MGPGTKLPSLGHTPYDYLKQTFALQAEGIIDGGADAFLIETSQDLLQSKAAVNGCTLVNLMMRFYELDAGRITLDGVDVASLPRRELRSRLGMVLQDTWLFGR